jgi:hypothetical protein
MATQLRNKKRLGTLASEVMKDIAPIKNIQFTTNKQPVSPNMKKKARSNISSQAGTTTQLRKKDPTYQPPVKQTFGTIVGGQGVNIQGATQLRSKNNQLVPMNKPLSPGLKAAQAKRQLKAQGRENRKTNARNARLAQSVYTGREKGYIPSSNVESVAYDAYLDKIYVEFKSGGVYEYDLKSISGSARLGLQVVTGADFCRTNDPTGLKRWWIGKIPSLGAAVYWNLVKTHIPYKRLK